MFHRDGGDSLSLRKVDNFLPDQNTWQWNKEYAAMLDISREKQPLNTKGTGKEGGGGLGESDIWHLEFPFPHTFLQFIH